MLCRKCGAALPLQEGSGRKRTMCEVCSPKNTRYKPVASVTQLPVKPGEGRLTTATRARLEELGRLDDPQGALALYHAELLDAGCGSQTATVSREYRAALADATRGVTGASSALDELRARRAARRGA
jgi:hypothetical protein